MTLSFQMMIILMVKNLKDKGKKRLNYLGKKVRKRLQESKPKAKLL